MAKSANFPRGSSGEAPSMLDEAQFRMTLDRPLGSSLDPDRTEGTYLVPISGNESPSLERGRLEINLTGIKQLPISDKAIEKIKEWESGRYKANPEWPEDDSGITIGYGYDFGYYSREKFREDWKPFLDDKTIKRLEAVMAKDGEKE